MVPLINIPGRFAFLTCLALIGASAVAARAESPPPTLHYQWTTGATCLYSLEIEASHPDYTEVLSGSCFYEVTDSTEGVTTLACRSALDEQPPLAPPGHTIAPTEAPVLPRFWSQDLGFGEDSFRSSQVRLDSTGHQLQLASALPALWGDAAVLIAQPLPASASVPQVTRRQCAVLVQSAAPNSKPAPPAPIPAQQQITWSLHATNPGATAGPPTGAAAPVGGPAGPVLIDIAYDLASLPGSTPGSAIHLSGKGLLSFDRDLGLPQSLRLSLTLEEASGGAPSQIPVILSFERVHPQPAGSDNTSSLSPSGANPSTASPSTVMAQDPALATPPGSRPLAPLSDELTEAFLQGIQSTDPATRRQSCYGFSRSLPNSHRSVVAAALAVLLTNPDSFTRQASMRALAVWQTPETMSDLLETLDDPDFSVRWLAMQLLAPLGDPSVADALARRLSDLDDRAAASDALKSMGTVAEPSVLPLLNADDSGVRQEACRILSVIGTAQAAPALEAADRKPGDALTSLAARQALDSIRQRGSTR